MNNSLNERRLQYGHIDHNSIMNKIGVVNLHCSNSITYWVHHTFQIKHILCKSVDGNNNLVIYEFTPLWWINCWLLWNGATDKRLINELWKTSEYLQGRPQPPGHRFCTNWASVLLFYRKDSVTWTFIRKFSALISGILKKSVLLSIGITLEISSLPWFQHNQSKAGIESFNLKKNLTENSHPVISYVNLNFLFQIFKNIHQTLKVTGY